MKINYVLLYGTPYLKYELFDTFKKMSDFIVKRSIVNYTIFEKMEDKKEVEMIYRDNDVRVLEKENEKLKELCNKYEEEHNNEFQCWKKDRKELLDKRGRIDKAIDFIKNNILATETEEILLDILRGEENE